MVHLGPEVVLVLGGARSGKSEYALHAASRYDGRRLFLATACATDAEMASRMERQRRQRGDSWETIEETLDVVGVIRDRGGEFAVLVLDCLNFWIAGLMEDADDPEIERRVRELLTFLRRPPCPVFIVSGEVGLGTEPESSEVRRFRDLLGYANQQLTRVSREVVLLVAGVPVPIKDPRAHHIL